MEKIKEYSWIILAVCLITVLMTGGVLLGREEENGLAEEDMVILKIWGSVPAGAGPNQVIEELTVHSQKRELRRSTVIITIRMPVIRDWKARCYPAEMQMYTFRMTLQDWRGVR